MKLIKYCLALIMSRRKSICQVICVVGNGLLRKLKLGLRAQYHMVPNKKFEKVKCSDSRLESWKRTLVSGSSFLGNVRPNLNSDIIKHKANIALNEGICLLGQNFKKENMAQAFLLDPGSNYTWNTNAWYLAARKDVPKGVDIKCPWEISRCYHFVLLGEAYLATNDEIYAKEYKDQILSWINSNPFGYGPNWSCTMEVGIRIANWLVGLLYFYRSPSLDDLFYRRLLLSIEEHGKHIMSNLENLSFFRSNHYLGNIAGLYFLAILCPVLNESKRWQKFAKKELEREMFEQTYADGWDYESATAYHRLVTEMFYCAFLLGQAMGDCFSDIYKERLFKMLECLNYTTKPDGLLPQIGDNDSGRFLVFNCDLDAASLNTDYISNWMDSLLNKPSNQKAENCSVVFEKGGRYILRSKSIYFLVTAEARDEYRINSHAHNDQLSFELNVFGEDVFVDPGTYTYTRDVDRRNSFRSITNHNVLHWPNMEPCSFEEGPFVLREKGILNVDKVKMGGLTEGFSGCYSYNNRFHRREIRFDRGREEIFIKDTCSHPGAQLSFICGPTIEPKIGNHSFIAGRLEVLFKGASKVEMVKGEYSPAYGVKMPVAKIIVHLRSNEISTQIIISKNNKSSRKEMGK